MRRIAFALLVVALAGGLLWSLFAAHPPSPVVPPHPRILRPPAGEAPVPIQARTAVRRFLPAFLADEVGDRSAPVRRAIRADAVGALARELLRAPARVPTDPEAARLSALDLHRLPGRPDLLLVSGTARRRSGPEPFAFIFARRGRRWLAVAPAE